MKHTSTLKRYALLCLLFFATVSSFSQNCGNPTTNCVAPTDQFTTASFGNPNGNFVYKGQDYQLPTGNTIGILSITSYAVTIQNNVFTAGAKLTAGVDKLVANATTIRVLDASTNTVLCQALVNVQTNGCLAASFGGFQGRTVKIEFDFFKTANGQLIFDDFGTDPAQAPLPVTFAGFEGKKTASGIQLTWKVGGEINVKQYDVERSTTGNSGFAKIGVVPAVGNSSYTFTDRELHNGAVFYRIKNVDNDGSFRYSTMLQFRDGAGVIVFRVVPTLVTNKTMVQHPATTGAALITLNAADGRVVRSLRPAAGAVQTAVDLSGLQAGLYLLKWNDGAGHSETTKLVKQ